MSIKTKMEPKLSQKRRGGRDSSVEGNSVLLPVDESTEGLVQILVQEVRNVLEEINQAAGVSILLVEHNLKVALSVARRVYLMGKAHIGYSGTVDDLRHKHEIQQKCLEV